MYKNNAKENKEKLLEMARNGEPKPTRKSHPLGQALINYTKKQGPAYDVEFDKLIHTLAPKWFEYGEGYQVKRTREKLINDAKNGLPKPPLRVCNTYLTKKGPYFDKSTVRKIKQLAPHWFVKRGSKILENKKQILELLEKGELCRKHPLYRAYYNYTYKGTNSFDPVFLKKCLALKKDL